MAYSGSDLLAEIRRCIDTKIEAGQPVPAGWVATEVAAAHANIIGPDAEFHFYCTRNHVRDQVTKALKHYKCELTKEADPQLVLPGYERLQRAYSILRDGEDVIVPIDALTDEKVELKAAELEAMAAGALKHADELRRYRRKRKAS